MREAKHNPKAMRSCVSAKEVHWTDIKRSSCLPKSLPAWFKQVLHDVYWIYCTLYGSKLIERKHSLLITEQFHPQIGNLMES